jgi:DNA recombination protein RmuC
MRMDALSLLVEGAIGVALGTLVGALLTQRRMEPRLSALDRERAVARETSVRAEAERDAARREFERWKVDAAARQAREDQHRAEQKDAEDRRRAEELAALKGEFAHLSREALKLNSETFTKEAVQTFDERRSGFDALLTPLREQLGKLAEGTHALETKREGAYTEVRQQITSLQSATETVNTNSRVLIQALRGDARARGRWGEMALRNVAELSGMTAHCDFDVQVVLDDRTRPDMVVRLPGGDGRIPVDAKAPMDAYMRAMDATDPDTRAAALLQHAAALRTHVRALVRRDYTATLGTRVDFTVLFVPAEPILAAAFEADPALQTEAMEGRILIATPVTLVALLRTVGLYWRQADLAQNAQEIAAAAGTLHERVRKFTDHVEAVGTSLEKAVRSWNAAVGSYGSRVLPAGRELEKLRPPAAADKALPDLATVDDAPRRFEAHSLVISHAR